MLEYCADREQLNKTTNVCLKGVHVLNISNFVVALFCHTIRLLPSCIGAGTSILLDDRGIEVCFPRRLRDLSLPFIVQTGLVSARVPVSCAPLEWRRLAGTGRVFLSKVQSGLSMKPSTHLCLAPSLSIRGATSSLPIRFYAIAFKYHRDN